MKRFIAFFLALLMLVMLLCSCELELSDKEDDDTSSTEDKDSSSDDSTSSSENESSSSSSSEGNDDIEELFKNSPKYDYNLAKYISLPAIKGHKIRVDLGEIQASIDGEIANRAVSKIVAEEADIVDVVITITEMVHLDTENGDTIDMKGEFIYSSDIASTYDKKETITIHSLGDGTFIKSIEDSIIGTKLGNDRTMTATLPEIEELSSLQESYPDAYERLAPYAGSDVYVSFSFVSRDTREGDVVEVSYIGYYTDENGDILVENGKEVTFEGGSGTSRVYLGARLFILDFEKGLVGLDVGKQTNIKATFPSDYGASELAGRTVIFKATVTDIYKAPKYDIDFINSVYGEHYTSVEEYENEILSTYALAEITDYLCKNSTVIEYPENEYKLYEAQLNELSSNFEESYGMTFETYLKNYIGYNSIEEYIHYIMKRELAYYAYAQLNGLTVTQKDFDDAKSELIELLKDNYMMSNSSLSEEKAREMATEYVSENSSYADIHQDALYNIVEDYILTDCVIEKIPANYTSVTNGGSLFE